MDTKYVSYTAEALRVSCLHYIVYKLETKAMGTFADSPVPPTLVCIRVCRTTRVLEVLRTWLVRYSSWDAPRSVSSQVLSEPSCISLPGYALAISRYFDWVTYSPPAPWIVPHYRHQKYMSSDRSHEAGYDSYITGSIMIRMLAYIGMKTLVYHC